MKSKNKIFFILIILISQSYFLNAWLYNNFKTKKFNFETTEKNKIHIKQSGFWNLTGAPLFINDTDPNFNWSKTALDNGWCSGSGSWSDPYIIENVTINGRNLANCIHIENSNVSFIIRNCTLYNIYWGSKNGIKLINVNNGNLINNNCSFNSNGISLSNCVNNSILTNTCNNNSYGIYLNNNCENSTISDNSLNGNYNRGIELEDQCKSNSISRNNISFGLYGIRISNNCDNNNISENFVNNIESRGIQLNDNKNNLITKNNLNNNNENGIFIFDSDSATILENKIYYAESGGIVLNGGFDNNLSKNLMTGCGIDARSMSNIEFSTLNIDINNKVNEKPIYYYKNSTNLTQNNFTNAGQIILYNCSDSIISNLNISFGSIGISLHSCNNFTISNNIVLNNTIYGMYLKDSNNSSIILNNISNNKDGIYCSSDCKISNNILINNDESGIILEGTYATVSNNTISSNKEHGIELKGDRNIIFDNIINLNRLYGISCSGNYNNITNNTVINNYGGISFGNCHNNNATENILYTNSNFGISIGGWFGSNYANKIFENFINNSLFGIVLYASESTYNNISSNFMYNCGIWIDSGYELDINDLITNTIDSQNKINGKPLYFVFNKTGLKTINFSNAGQIILINCNNSNISNLNTTQGTCGILLINCENNTLTKNNASNNTWAGIYLVNCENNTLSQNEVSFNSYGIYSYNCNNTKILRNIIDTNIELGINIVGYNYTISNNTMFNCGLAFISYDVKGYSSNDIDTTNKVNNRILYYYFDKKGLTINNFTNAGQIILINCNDSFISSLNLSRSTCSLTLHNSNNNAIFNNTLSDNNIAGLWLSGSNNNNFSYNYIENNYVDTLDYYHFGYGIVSLNSNNNSISRNKISRNDYGIYIISSNVCTILDNNIEYNNYYGISLHGNNNTIIKNSIINNAICGLGIDNPMGFLDQSNLIYYNNFSRNGINAYDGGVNNKWDDGFVGNHWDDCIGNDTIPIDGIINSIYLISGGSQDTKPFLYPINSDTDGDGLNNYEEYTLGNDNYRTNVTNSDSDYDGLSDYWEWFNLTNPWNNDTDFDLIPDGWEVRYLLDPLENDAFEDPDNDQLLNIYEFLNGTNPHMADTDSDSIIDSDEIRLHTDPLNRWWYPMPNLAIISFGVSDIYEGQSFVLNFTISNNGIWRAEGIYIIIRVEALDRIIYDNYANPLDLEANETRTIYSEYSHLTTPGIFYLNITIDPANLINETYSSIDASWRSDWAEDNTKMIEVRVIPVAEDLGFLWIVFVIILSVTIFSSVGLYFFLKPKLSRIIHSRRQIQDVKSDLYIFENNIRSYLRAKLKEYYINEWWERGVPEDIRTKIQLKLSELKESQSQIIRDGIDLLDFSLYPSIITKEENWENIFADIFIEKASLTTSFEKLTDFNKKLHENSLNPADILEYPVLIYSIRKYITKGFNVFLSYSTLDTDHFKIKEVASLLEFYPKIDKVFFWEADSGENIVNYMERTLKICKVFILFCSGNAIKSNAVEDEWQVAFQLRKKGEMKIVPIYEYDEYIPYLLMPLLNVRFTKDNIEGFIEKLYEEILRK